MTTTPRPGRARPPWLLALLAFAIVTAVTAGALEGVARAFWSLAYRVPFNRPSRILYAWYPELERVSRKQPARDDEFYDVLLLGGSVLHNDWGQVERALAERLAFGGRPTVRMFNLAMPAHTSRDSRLKYAALGRARFELVVVYHGINDTRTNNVPPELYRADYSHYAWYETVNAMTSYHRRAVSPLPYTLKYVLLSLRQRLQPGRYAPREAPRPEWLQYGSDYRSARALESNLRAILDLARRRGDPVLLASFATHVPADYSPEAFAARRLDYGLHLSAIEEWGRPSDVLGAITAQNEAVRRLASGDSVLFVDLASLMAGDPRWFNDACHLTVEGSLRFAERLAEAVDGGEIGQERGGGLPSR